MGKISRLYLLCLRAGFLALAGCSGSGTADAAKAKAEAEAARAELAHVKSELTHLKGELAKLRATRSSELPVKARLVAPKTTFTLDLNGLTAAEYTKLLINPDLGKLPRRPEVEMALELTNTSDKSVQVLIRGSVILMLKLEGPGAVRVAPRGDGKTFIEPPDPGDEAVTLAPGKSHFERIPSSYLTRGGPLKISGWAYWTEPGDYTLSASLLTALNPSPKDVKPDKDGFGKVTLSSEPIKIKVENKK